MHASYIAPSGDRYDIEDDLLVQHIDGVRFVLAMGGEAELSVAFAQEILQLFHYCAASGSLTSQFCEECSEDCLELMAIED